MADNENSGLSNLPVWARFVGWVGIPGTIAGFLVYALVQFVSAGIIDIQKQMTAHAAVLIQHELKTDRADDNIARLLLRICINTSKTETDRQRCVL